MFDGEYRVYQDGNLLATHKNLITDYGRQTILRYLAGDVASFAGALAIGSAQNPASVSDVSMGFEISRAPIYLKTPNFDTGEIVLSASLDEPIAGVVYEFGIFPHVIGIGDGIASGINLRFEELEEWTGGTYNLSVARVGSSSYQLTADASATSRASVRDRVFGLAELAANDTFSLAYFVNDANTNEISLEFHSTVSDYFRYTFDPSATPGYYVTNWPKSSFITVGNPSWDTIMYLDVLVNATALGSTVVQFDGLRINTAASLAENKLVSRSVNTTASVKNPSTPLDIEYVLRYANG